MAITAADIKLVASSVMNDATEGGGPPSSTVIQDAVSNAIFPDISELDRAGGRVNMRKVFAAVQTDDTDGFLGANVIVADPPDDPNVTVTLFSTESTFDRRTAAASRVESYLAPSAEWGGFLYEQHIIGQRVIQLMQRPNTTLPLAGQTLVLIKNEGLVTEVRQFVRATDVTYTERQFYDQQAESDYTAWIVDVAISDALRNDFPGTSANRSFARATSAARVRETNVADAGIYAGVVPLELAASTGDFTVQAETVFTQIVPSAQTETALTDIRTNGLQNALVAGGGPVTRTVSATFSTTQALFLGGPAYPGSISIARDGVTLTDRGGKLLNGEIEVGGIDYDAGIATLLSNVFGTGGGTHTVTFRPAATPELISSHMTIRVTAESRALTYTGVIDSVPLLPRGITISYLAQGRWYVLRDDAGGRIAGQDSAYGIGTVNYETGALSVTLGALPDVGSSVVIQYFTDANAPDAGNTTLANGGKAYIAFNTDGQASEAPGSRPITINGLSITWSDGTQKTATDDGFGNISGDATGTVDYSDGVVRLSPNAMPAAGTVFLFDLSSGDQQTATGVTWSGGTGNIGATNIIPGSVRFQANLNLTYAIGTPPGYSVEPRLDFALKSITVTISDNGSGALKFTDPGNGLPVTIGTIDYAAGTFTITASQSIDNYDHGGPIIRMPNGTWPNSSIWYEGPWNRGFRSAQRTRGYVLTSESGDVDYASQLAAPDSVSLTVNEYRVKALELAGYSLQSASFTLGGSQYQQLPNNAVVRDQSPATGQGTLAGTVNGAAATVILQSWATGGSPTVGDWRGVLAPPTQAITSPFGAVQAILRTAASPIRVGSFSVLGTMLDGSTFNVTADSAGKLDGTRVKGRIDYEYGLVELFFVDPNGNPDQNVDLSYLQIPGLTTIPADIARTNTLRYNAVSFTYLPLDADLLGIDPVRLPNDGRVPIFRAGGFAVVGNTDSTSATVANGQTVDVGRVRLSRVRVIGSDGLVITTGYTADLEVGTVTFTDVTGYAQPVTIEHRIEDMAVVSQVDINGEITFTRPITHNYPAPGSFVSSALVAGDLFARVSITFDQATWNGTWSDEVSGSAATGTYNTALNPILVTNRGAITERWAIQFTSATGFNVIGENVGVIATGNTGSNLSPTNPATGAPYFTIAAAGWGLGWATGNVLRFNTIGAQFPVWVLRTIQQGPETVTNDSFTLLIRGDVDQP